RNLRYNPRRCGTILPKTLTYPAQLNQSNSLVGTRCLKLKSSAGRGGSRMKGHAKAKSSARFLLLLAAAVALTACEGVNKIANSNKDPSQFRNKTVRVEGTVTNSVGVLSTGGYEIEDDTGKIFVVSNQGVPARGSKVIVEGSVFTGAMVLGQP